MSLDDAGFGETMLPGDSHLAEPADDGRSERAYLFLVDGDASRICYLPPTGEVVVGRGTDATIRVGNASVSRKHAAFRVRDGRVEVSDLGSHNGTRVNGERISGTQPLRAGDVVTLSSLMLVLQRRGAPRAAREVHTTAQLFARLEQEVDRSLRFERPLSFACVRIEAPDRLDALAASLLGALRIGDVLGRVDHQHLGIVMPELPADLFGQVLGRLRDAVSDGRIGVASCPLDACDADALVEGARASAGTATGGGVALATAIPLRELGGALPLVLADPVMLRIVALLRRLAEQPLAILLHGPRKVGKRTLATAIHRWSPRADGPMVEIDLEALPPERMDGALFGTATQPGLIRTALGGTLLLREVARLPGDVQRRLLGLVDAAGTLHPHDYDGPRDVRVVATSTSNLETEATRGRFLSELATRLMTRAAMIPPLCDRPRDVAVIARQLATQLAGGPVTLSAGALRILGAHTWPGNVGELRAVVQHAVGQAAGQPEIEDWHLPTSLGAPEPVALAAEPDLAATLGADQVTGPLQVVRSLQQEVRALERRRIAEALRVCGGDPGKAAHILGLTPAELESKRR